jgi:hypothetical protein
VTVRRRGMYIVSEVILQSFGLWWYLRSMTLRKVCSFVSFCKGNKSMSLMLRDHEYRIVENYYCITFAKYMKWSHCADVGTFQLL